MKNTVRERSIMTMNRENGKENKRKFRMNKIKAIDVVETLQESLNSFNEILILRLR